MGREFFDAQPELAALFQQADEVSGQPVSDFMFNGPQESLNLTLNAQPALVTTEVAAARALIALGVKPAVVAGHSIGEYAALHVADVMEFPVVLGLVVRRAQLMYEASTGVPGSMAAVLGLEDDAIEAICAETRGTVVVANYNSPGQAVISGTPEAVEAAIEACKAAGAKRALKLAVSGAFHSPLMDEAAASLATDIAAVRMQDAAIPVVCNVDGFGVSEAALIRENLSRQMRGSVRWTQSVREMSVLGVTDYVECGPGKVLSGLIRRIEPSAAVHNVSTPAEATAVAEALQN